MDLSSLRDAHQAFVDELDRSIRRVNREKVVRTGVISTLESRLSLANEKLQRLQLDLVRQTLENRKLTDRFNSETKNAADLNASITRVNCRMDSLMLAIRDVETVARQTTSNYELYTELIYRLKRSQCQLLAWIDEEKEKYAGVKKELEQRERENSEICAEIRQLTKTATQNQQLLAESKRAAEEIAHSYVNEISILQDQLQRNSQLHKEDQCQFEVEKTSLVRQIEEIVKKHEVASNELADQRARLQSQVCSLLGKLEEVKLETNSKLSQLEGEKSTLRAELDDAKQLIRAQQSQLESVKEETSVQIAITRQQVASTIELNESTISLLQTENASFTVRLQTTVKASQQQIAKLQAENKVLEQERARLTETSQTSAASLEKLTEENSLLKQEIFRLEGKCVADASTFEQQKQAMEKEKTDLVEAHDTAMKLLTAQYEEAKCELRQPAPLSDNDIPAVVLPMTLKYSVQKSPKSLIKMPSPRFGASPRRLRFRDQQPPKELKDATFSGCYFQYRKEDGQRGDKCELLDTFLRSTPEGDVILSQEIPPLESPDVKRRKLSSQWRCEIEEGRAARD